MVRQILKFGLVGGLATGVHMVIGFLLIHAGWPVLIANGAAFIMAFLVSLAGHLGFTFADQQADFPKALWKFAAVAVTGFGCNQAILSCIVLWSDVADTTALFIATTCSAIVTFVLSRSWAFRAAHKHECIFSQKGKLARSAHG